MSIRFPNSRYLGNATVNGSLFDLGQYPGLRTNVLEPPVIGEIYEVDDELLNELDEFEASSNYLRKRAEVLTGEHRKLCWVYEPDPEYYSFTKLIKQGDWVEYARMKGE
jgi:gamma-glutamylcyclotransferase (GGCT)/AIG2-like uncharacterized protein YtfP